jgi:hypothetical protein
VSGYQLSRRLRLGLVFRGNDIGGKRFLPSSFAKATEDRAVEMTEREVEMTGGVEQLRLHLTRLLNC